MTHKLQALSMLFLFSFMLYACTSSKTTATSALSYSKDVRSIINENCANTCHGADHPAAGINLTTYALVKDQALNGKLIPAIQHLDGVDPMPKKAPKLDDALINTIVQWAASGAVE